MSCWMQCYCQGRIPDNTTNTDGGSNCTKCDYAGKSCDESREESNSSQKIVDLKS